jgi:hypothetical protein
LQRYIDVGLVEINGTKALVKRPELLKAFAEMRGFGMPTDALVKLHSEVSMSVDGISQALVGEAVRQVGNRFDLTREPTGEELGDLVVTLTRFRELAMSTVVGTLAESMERTIEDLLATFLAQALPGADKDAV